MRSEQAVENLAEAEHWHRLAIDRLLENDCLQAFEFVKKAIAIDAGRAHFFSTAGSIFLWPDYPSKEDFFFNEDEY